MSVENAQKWLQKYPHLIPALAHNQHEIVRLLELGQQTHNVVTVAISDPGLCLALLIKVNSKRGPESSKDIVESPKAAMAILGEHVCRTMLEDFPVAETVLKDPDQLFLYQQLINRSLHNGTQAELWSNKLGFQNIELIKTSALLCYTGELLCCIYDFRTYRRFIQSGSNEQHCEKLFGFKFSELTEILSQLSNLPELITQSLTSNKDKRLPATLLHYTSRVCHLCEAGWYHPPLAQQLQNFSEWLQLTEDKVIFKTHQHSIKAARNTAVHDAWQPAARLILEDDSVWSELKMHAGENQSPHTFSKKPPAFSTEGNSLQKVLTSLNKLIKQPKASQSEVLGISMKSLPQDFAMSRVSLLLLTSDKNTLRNRMSLGFKNDSPFRQYSVDVDQSGLLKLLLAKPQAIWINKDNIEKYKKLIPQRFIEGVATDTFLAMSLFIGDKPLGIVYSDRFCKDPEIQAQDFAQFKKLISFTSKALTLLSKR